MYAHFLFFISYLSVAYYFYRHLHIGTLRWTRCETLKIWNKHLVGLCIIVNKINDTVPGAFNNSINVYAVWPVSLVRQQTFLFIEQNRNSVAGRKKCCVYVQINSTNRVYAWWSLLHLPCDLVYVVQKTKHVFGKRTHVWIIFKHSLSNLRDCSLSLSPLLYLY